MYWWVGGVIHRGLFLFLLSEAVKLAFAVLFTVLIVDLRSSPRNFKTFDLDHL
jgi:hypothetical protein